MGIRSFLFGDKTKIRNEILDPELGRLIWVKDDESWKGTYSGMEFLLAFENGKDSPSQEVRNYALSVLSSTSILEDALEAEKRKYIAKYPNSEKEVAALRYEVVNFYRYKSRANRIIASLGPGENFRAWRIEFAENVCEGLGFDS